MSAANVDIMSVMGSDVAELYTNYGKLSAASLNPAQMALEAPSYQAILASVKGSDAVKQLAADYIPQFLHHFPALVESGINAQLDLIEDENATIRIHAIRGLEGIAKHNPSTVGRIADVLAQLLVVPDALEMNVVKATFHALFKIDAKAAFLALFTQATAAPDVALRKTVREFIQAQLRPLTPALKKDAAAAAALCAGLKALLGAAQPSADLLLAPSELQFFLQALLAFTPHAGNATKIRADEPLKTELAIIAANQAGLKPGSGALDTTNEAALKHFLEVQSIMGRLQKDYGVDSTPFIAVYFGQLLPSIDTIADAELRAKILQAIAANATNLSAKQAQTYFATFFAGFKQALPKGEIVAPIAAAAAAGDATAAAAAPSVSPVASSEPGAKINFSTAEVYLYLFHIFAPLAPTELKAATGIFEPTGQPGESLTAPNDKRDEFFNRIQYLLQSNASYKASLHAVQKTLREQISAAGKALALAKAKENGAKAKAAQPALAGQPTGPEKPIEPAAAVATDGTSTGPTLEEQSESLKALKSKAASVDAAIRISANAVALAQPLLHKPLPKFLAPANMHLSWRQHKAQTQQGKGKPTGKPTAGAKQPQGGKQQQAQQGQKRKSSGPDASTKSTSNKKRGANQQQQGGQQQQQGAKKARREGNQQQQQQGNAARSGKKQKQRR